jgi:predicted dehydrogenase/nucleoside-diphosphate-sugar epimerase
MERIPSNDYRVQAENGSPMTGPAKGQPSVPASNLPNNPESTQNPESGGVRGKHRVALLGAGYIADWHAQCLRSVAGVELVAVCDRFVSKAETLARRFGIPNVYGSLDEMLATESLHAVHVLLPPDRHFEAARTALESGVDVFLEKPMCDRAKDCEELVHIASTHGRRLGVGHNFLFAPIYEQLRRDVRSGALGRIDHLTITWHRPLPQILHGPFDSWMLRDPRNILIEVGPHLVSQMLDLVGEPNEIHSGISGAIPEATVVRPSNPVELPNGRKFYRRWQVDALAGSTAVNLRLSFVPGFSEYTIHARGTLASATVDFDRNTYSLDQHRPADPDFETHSIVVARAKSLKTQARRTLSRYIKSKLHLEARGNSYGDSIARAMDAFYSSPGTEPDRRVDGQTGARVIALCEQMGALANLPAPETVPWTAPQSKPCAEPPRILVLGGTGFIGKELLRELTAAGHNVRLLARGLAGIPRDLRESGKLDCIVADVADKAALLRAMEGIDCVFHLARANVKSWADYQELEIEATRRVADCALAAKVKRFIYTGTIDSYYLGAKAGVITESTPLDPRIDHRNLYARAKAASEKILQRMHREQGLPLVIVRPGIVIGRGGSPFHWGVGRWWNDAVCEIWDDGRNMLPLVLVEDVAAGLIAAMQANAIDGRSFNLVADPSLTAQQYLDELDRAGRMKIQRRATSIFKFYREDMLKWLVKVAVRHPERRMPSYRDWESRTAKAVFDCSAAKSVLGWKPASDRVELIQKGIIEPLHEFLD